MTLRSTPDQTPTRSVQTVDELQQVETSELLDGDQVYTVTTNQYWRVAKSSTATLTTKIRPTRNSASGVLAGRWFLFAGDGVANEAYAQLLNDAIIVAAPLIIFGVFVTLTTTGGSLFIESTVSGNSLVGAASTLSIFFTITPVVPIPGPFAGATSTGSGVTASTSLQKLTGPLPPDTYTVALFASATPVPFAISAQTASATNHADIYVAEVV